MLDVVFISCGGAYGGAVQILGRLFWKDDFQGFGERAFAGAA